VSWPVRPGPWGLRGTHLTRIVLWDVKNAFQVHGLAFSDPKLRPFSCGLCSGTCTNASRLHGLAFLSHKCRPSSRGLGSNMCRHASRLHGSAFIGHKCRPLSSGLGPKMCRHASRLHGLAFLGHKRRPLSSGLGPKMCRHASRLHGLAGCGHTCRHLSSGLAVCVRAVFDVFVAFFMITGHSSYVFKASGLGSNLCRSACRLHGLAFLSHECRPLSRGLNFYA